MANHKKQFNLKVLSTVENWEKKKKQKTNLLKCLLKDKISAVHYKFMTKQLKFKLILCNNFHYPIAAGFIFENNLI